MKTKVVFRKWITTGTVIALFPRVPSDQFGHHCMSYEHVGQHGAASPDLNGLTIPAKPHEYAPLKAELEVVGYSLDVRSRISQADHAARRGAAK